MNRLIPIICGLFLATTASAFETVEQCKEEYRIWRSGETLPIKQSNQVCECAAQRAEETPITNRHLLLCQWKIRTAHNEHQAERDTPSPTEK